MNYWEMAKTIGTNLLELVAVSYLFYSVVRCGVKEFLKIQKRRKINRIWK